MTELSLQSAESRNADDDFVELVIRYLAGELDEHQRNRLNAELNERPDRCDEFVSICLESRLIAVRVGVEVAAEDHGDADLSDDDFSQVNPLAERSFISSNAGLFGNAWHGVVNTPHNVSLYFEEHPMAFAYLVTTVLFIVAAPILWHWKVSSSSPSTVAFTQSPAASSSSFPSEISPPSAAAKAVVVGRITGEIDCQWKQGSVAGKKKQQALVTLGDRFALKSGLLEITYATGAKVILEGPCTYTAETNGGFLSVGRLTGKLEKKVGREKSGVGSESRPSSSPHSPIRNPFVIATPTALITDLGTEFGVEVGEKGNTTSHVFRGRVAVRMIPLNGQRGQDILLNANESVQVERESRGEGVSVRRVAVNSAAFMRSERFLQISEEMRLRPFHRWESYSRRLRSDPSLLAYYDFQRRKDAPDVLPNVADNGGRALDGKIIGATWCGGRMHGKPALQFDGVGSRVEIQLPQRVDDLTLAAWVYIESLENAFGNLLMSDGWNRPGGAYWYFRSDDQHLFFNLAGARGPWRFSPEFGWNQFQKWTHLAVVYDHVAKNIVFYRDGRLIDTIAPQGATAVRIGAARIGNWDSTGYTGPAKEGGFCGLIDELAIFGRPLSVSEIQAMFESKTPLAAAKVASRRPAGSPHGDGPRQTVKSTSKK